MKRSPFRRVLQVAAFVRKETVDVANQPRLLASLVIAPFVILLAFGLGYRKTQSPYRAWFVAPAGSVFLDRVRDDADQLGRYIRIAGTGTDPEAAKRKLQKGEIDVVVQFPDRPLDTILSGEQAPIAILHNRIDPIELTAIDFASRLAVDEVNGQILAGIVTSGQDAAAPLREPFAGAADMVSAADQAMARGDSAEARRQLDELSNRVGTAEAGVTATTAMLAQFSAQGGGAETVQQHAATVIDDIAKVRQHLGDAQRAANGGDLDRSRVQLGALHDALTAADANFSTFTNVEAKVLVRPFVSSVASVTPTRGVVSDFYAPAAVMLLVQQFGVAFGALSFVRERELGILEVFRAAPLGPSETVVGKYIGYLLVGGGVAAALMALVVWGLRTPMNGRWSDAVVALALTLLASIGLGLAISLASPNDTQAVQFTMITLLASLFFSGFFLAVEQLTYPARVLSWLLPSTFGNQLLRDVMLRGVRLDRTATMAIAAYGVLAFVLTWLGTRRRLAGDA